MSKMVRGSLRLKAKLQRQAGKENASTSQGSRKLGEASQRDSHNSSRMKDLNCIKEEAEDERSEIHIGEAVMYEEMGEALVQKVIGDVKTDDQQKVTCDSDYGSETEGQVQKQNFEAQIKYMSAKKQNLVKQKILEANKLVQPHIICNGSRSYECGICGLQVSRKKLLKLHLLSRHSNDCRKRCSKVFNCDICNLNFPNELELKEHISCHSGSQKFKCSQCYKMFSKKQGLIQHLQIHSGIRPFKCEICNSSFVTKGNLQAHEKRHFEVRNWVCNVCSKDFRRKDQLKKHVATVHDDQGVFTCSICDKSVKGHALSHLRIHLNEKQFKCHYCSMRFIQSSQLVVHLRTHTGDRPYPCKICNVSFAHSSALRVHTRIHTGEKPAKCLLCNAAFSQLPHLKKHMRCIHKTDKPYVCVPCKAFFKTKAELEEHTGVSGCLEIPPPAQCTNLTSTEDEDEEIVDEPGVLESGYLITVKTEIE